MDERSGYRLKAVLPQPHAQPAPITLSTVSGGSEVIPARHQNPCRPYAIDFGNLQ
jgi:hypothetical protein